MASRQVQLLRAKSVERLQAQALPCPLVVSYDDISHQFVVKWAEWFKPQQGGYLIRGRYEVASSFIAGFYRAWIECKQDEK